MQKHATMIQLEDVSIHKSTHIYHSFTVVTVSVTMVWDKYVKEE